MTTMAAKLKSKAMVVRTLTAEVRAIKEIAKRRPCDTAGVMVTHLYEIVRSMLITEAYSSQEVRKLVDVSIHEVEKELKEMQRRRKALEKEAKKIAEKEATHGNTQK